jgi:predicted transcriptional regulator of viral defense system
MKNKNVSYRSLALLKELSNSGKSYFTVSDAYNIFNEHNLSAVRELLRSMTERGLIMRIKEGLYHVIPFEKDSAEYFPNWHLTAEALVQSEEYYIGFYSALDIHGLITQPSLVEQVVLKKRIQPKHFKLKNVRFEMITFNQNHFFGYEKTWVDDFNKVNCSDLEKTIIDCLYKPNYANGITEIVKAIYKSRNNVNPKRLLVYLDKFDAQVVYKRLGYLLQNLNLFKKLLERIKPRISNSYALLDPSLPKTGKHNSQWKVIDNIGIESSLKSVET